MLRRWFATPHLALQFCLLYLTLLIFVMRVLKTFFKTSGRPNILFSTTFAGYQINNFSTVTLQNSLNFIFQFGNKPHKISRTNKKFLQMSYFLLHSSIELLLCLTTKAPRKQ